MALSGIWQSQSTSQIAMWCVHVHAKFLVLTQKNPGYPVSTTAKCYRRLLSKVAPIIMSRPIRIIGWLLSSVGRCSVVSEPTEVHIRIASVCGLPKVGMRWRRAILLLLPQRRNEAYLLPQRSVGPCSSSRANLRQHFAVVLTGLQGSMQEHQGLQSW